MNGIWTPAISGQFASWRYFQVILKVQQLVENLGTEAHPNYRIKTVDEIEEIYSRKGVSELLQRTYDPKRLVPIKNFMLHQPERYVNNLTIGIYGGDPDWHAITFRTAGAEVPSDFAGELGFIRLSGSETLFVLDGQHRIKGLRAAHGTKGSVGGQDEIACTLVIHAPNKEGRVRTRKLFSTINRHAKPVSEGENILLDEDDVSAISVRALIEDFKPLQNKQVVALSKTGNLNKADWDNLTTVVTAYAINETIVDGSAIYPKYDGKHIRVRPSAKVVDAQIDKVFGKWNEFMTLFPVIGEFISADEKKRRAYREGGGPFILRPIAQLAFFELMRSLKKNELKRVAALPLDLNDSFWHHVMWNPIQGSQGAIISNRSLLRNYIRYHIGVELSPKEKNSLLKAYRASAGNDRIRLPRPQG